MGAPRATGWGSFCVAFALLAVADAFEARGESDSPIEESNARRLEEEGYVCEVRLRPWRALFVVLIVEFHFVGG